MNLSEPKYEPHIKRNPNAFNEIRLKMAFAANSNTYSDIIKFKLCDKRVTKCRHHQIVGHFFIISSRPPRLGI